MFSFCLQGLVVLLSCSPYEDWVFLFFGLKISNCSPLKLVFSEGPSFFVRSVSYHGALKLRLDVATLPASLAMSWPAENTWKLNRSGIDFLVLVLQSSNSFILNAFFNFASVNFFLATWFMFSFCLQGLVVLLSCSPYEDWIFFVFWFKNFKLFPVKARFFRRPFIFCTFCFLSWGFETAPGRGNPASVIDHAMTSRDYIKVEQVRTWLLSSCLAVLRQIIFWMLFSSLLQLSFSWLHGSCSVFASRVLWFFVLFSIRGLDFLVF